MCSQNFSFVCKKRFLRTAVTRDSTEGEIFLKVLVQFKKKGLKWKLITTASYFEEKFQFFFLRILFFTKNIFFYVNFFFLIFCFLPTYMFNFNNLGLKWKLITTDSYLRVKIRFFIFWHQFFFENFWVYGRIVERKPKTCLFFFANNLRMERGTVLILTSLSAQCQYL